MTDQVQDQATGAPLSLRGDGTNGALLVEIVGVAAGDSSTATLQTAGNASLASIAAATPPAYTEDAPSAPDPVGHALIARRRDTLSTTEVSADADNIALNASSKGQLHVVAEITGLDTTVAAIVAGQDDVGVAPTTKPVSVAYRVATALPTPLTDGQLVRPMASKEGRTIVASSLRTSRNVLYGTAADTSAHIIVAGSATLFRDPHIMWFHNAKSGAATVVTVSDGTNSFSLPLEAGEKWGFALGSDCGLKQTAANHDWTMTCSVTSSVSWGCQAADKQ